MSDELDITDSKQSSKKQTPNKVMSNINQSLSETNTSTLSNLWNVQLSFTPIHTGNITKIELNYTEIQVIMFDSPPEDEQSSEDFNMLDEKEIKQWKTSWNNVRWSYREEERSNIFIMILNYLLEDK